MTGWTPVSPWKIVDGTGQKLTAGASSAQSTAVGTQTRAVMLTAQTANVRVAIGPNPVATASSLLVKTTDPPLVLGCGAGDKIAYLQDSSGGQLNIIELTH